MTRQHAGSNTLRVPITVSLVTPTSARNITREVGDVRFRHTIPGGFASCSADLNRAFTDYSEELRQFAMLRMTDGRNGGILSEGRLEDPGRTASASGQVWALSAIGAQAHAKDHAGPYVAIDSSMTSWQPAPKQAKTISHGTEAVTDEWFRNNNRDASGNLITGDDMNAPRTWFDGLRATVSTGTILLPYTDVASFLYPLLADSGQTLASIVGSFINGNMTGTGPGAGAGSEHKTTLYVGLDPEFTTGFTTLSTPSDNRMFFNGKDPITFAWRRSIDWNSATNLESVPAVTWRFNSNANNPSGTPQPPYSLTAGGATWWAFTAVVRPIMRDQHGTSIPANSPFNTGACSTDEIFADLMGTRLPLWDPATTVITPGTTDAINQFAFPDPTTVDQLLEELMGVEGGLYYWAAWESYQRTIAGLTTTRARAEWSLWPSEVRHIIGMDDGCDLPTSTEQVYDSVTVRWKDAKGQTRATIVTAANDLLTGAGVARRGSVDAGDNVVVDKSGATLFGARWLADHAAPRGTGTLTVARPVLDRLTGRMLAPWELRPGCLVQIAGADPSAYSQGATARNGRNVFRVIATEFDSSSASARLELDSPPNSIWDQVATANRDLVQRRRR